MLFSYFVWVVLLRLERNINVLISVRLISVIMMLMVCSGQRLKKMKFVIKLLVVELMIFVRYIQLRCWLVWLFGEILKWYISGRMVLSSLVVMMMRISVIGQLLLVFVVQLKKGIIVYVMMFVRSVNSVSEWSCRLSPVCMLFLQNFFVMCELIVMLKRQVVRSSLKVLGRFQFLKVMMWYQMILQESVMKLLIVVIISVRVKFIFWLLKQRQRQ